ncbi:MAG: serine hydrolase domain-containing protein [Gemmatimonadales bacterium]
MTPLGAVRLTCCAAVVVGCGGGAPADPGPPRLPAALPAGDQLALLRAVTRAQELDPLNSLLVSHRDTMVVERYFRGMRADRAVNVKSVSKTLLSPLVGIAIRDSLLTGPDQPLYELLPGYIDAERDTVRRRITLHHLLSMTMGLEGTSFDNYGSWVTSRDWVRYALNQPVICEPGGCREYSTGNTHILSAILTRAAGTDLITWGRRVLYDDLGIELRPWDRDPQGYYLGGNNMRLTPRELVAFGRLFLDSGRVGVRQLVPWEWIERSWAVVNRSRWSGSGYGYLWWTRRINGETVRYGWGYGGQFLFLVPRLDLVVVVTSSLTNRPRRVRHNPRVYDLLGCYVIPAFRDEPRLGPCDWRGFRVD